MCSIIVQLEGVFGVDKIRSLSKGTFVGLAFSANIGGIGTLIGTAPNLAFARLFEVLFPEGPSINFASWLGIGLPST